MLRREVIGTEDEYNFDMHLLRTLVTNFFPAEYDVEVVANPAVSACHAHSICAAICRTAGARVRSGAGG